MATNDQTLPEDKISFIPEIEQVIAIETEAFDADLETISQLCLQIAEQIYLRVPISLLFSLGTVALLFKLRPGNGASPGIMERLAIADYCVGLSRGERSEEFCSPV